MSITGKLGAVLAGFMLLLSACSSANRGPLIADADADGVTDELDRCADSASRSIVRSDGCSLFGGPIDKLEFTAGDHRLGLSARESLAEIRDAMVENSSLVVSLGGHTDNRGTAADNLQLSKRRVMSVVRYLVANGISGERLKPYGYGESQPAVSNASEAGRAQNRRIEVHIVSR